MNMKEKVMPITKIKAALSDIRQGKMVIRVDDERV
jgi:hypothetical protein